MKAVLTIAGSDSSGGAGIQADLKTIIAHRLFGESVITALTAQNTTGVFGVMDVDPAFVGAQMDAVFDDIRPDAVKIGMVSSPDIVRAIADGLRRHHACNIVVDPVMVATSGSALIADAAVDALVSDEVVQKTAKEFQGVPHRIEFVREIGGVKYYNDSIASSPARTTAGLISFGDQKVILIAGGYDKKIPFDDFGAVVNDHVKELVLVGVTAQKIQDAVEKADNFKGLAIHRCDDFKAAVCKAKEIAKEGDIVILSPACASFDLFPNFEVRGNTFKEIVNAF